MSLNKKIHTNDAAEDMQESEDSFSEGGSDEGEQVSAGNEVSFVKLLSHITKLFVFFCRRSKLILKDATRLTVISMESNSSFASSSLKLISTRQSLQTL